MMTPLDAIDEVERHFANLRNDDLWICVPDLHGCSGLAVAVNALSRKTRFQVAILGDMIDRTGDSVKTVEAIRELKQARPDVVTIKGNHCQQLLDLYHSSSGLPTKGCAVEEFATEAACQYGERYGGTIPDKHLAFLESLKVYHRGRNIILMHGGISSPTFADFDVADIPSLELLWGYGTHRSWLGPKVVAGHLLVEEPVETNVAIQLDSGCWLPRPDARLTIGIVDDRDDVQRRLKGWIEIRRDTLAARVVWCMPDGRSAR